MRNIIGTSFAILIIFMGTGLLYAQESRYALVIGNSSYRDKNVSNLANPANDASDIAAGLKDLGYRVTLKTNVGLREMSNAIRDFTGDLERNSNNEGFFWFAGHGLSVKNTHYMLPVDVDPTDDFSIPRTAFSVDDLMAEIENARNRTNLIVIDACRNAVIPGSRSVGSRGLTVLSRDDYRIRGNKLVYSTMAGKVASDGAAGSRNSPFAQAFLSKLKEPESFDDVFLEIASETMRLTRGDQEPYALGAFAIKSYSLNPKGVEEAHNAAIQAAVQAALSQQAAAQQAAAQTAAAVKPAETPAAPETGAETAKAAPKVKVPVEKAPRIKPEKSPDDFILDGKKMFSLSAAVSAYPSTFTEGGFGGGITVTYHEKYGSYGESFFLQNSFNVSADLFRDTQAIKSEQPQMPYDGKERYAGGIIGLGALYKIRIGEKQRFIANFGPSFEMFMAQSQFFYDDAQRYYSYNNGSHETMFRVLPGIGLHGGISFRLSQLASLDFNIAWKQAFVSGDIGLHVKYQDNSTNYLVFSDSVFPRTFGACLGVTFWWPR